MLESQEPGNPTRQFGGDHPIRSSKEDLLGRWDFAKSLSTAIYNWSGSESLVVSLYGAWGSGKSSVKNMIVEALENMAETQRPTIIEFNAWQFSGQDGLLEAFFSETGKVLGIEDKSRAGQKLAAKWRSLSAFFRVVRTASEGTKKIVEVVFYILPPLTLSYFTGSNVVFVLGLIAIAGIANSFSGLSDWISSSSESIADWLTARVEAQRKTLEERKKEISDLLKQRIRPLLIIIDDIDRLTATEIQLIFRLVKANLDLPNVAYLLLFQRESVEEALKKISTVSGRDFLEKIVQAGFDIPAVERKRLEKVLFTGLDGLIANGGIGSTFDRKRWENIFIPGLRPYFESLRDVYRFLSTLRFHVGVLKGQASFEVNVVDLIALEVIRTFEPEVYYALRVAKDELTGRAQLYRIKGLEKDTNDYVRKVIEHLVNLASKDHEPYAKEILKQLFPPIEWVFQGSQYGESFQDRWYRERRICSYDVFDRYFILGIPYGDVSHSELQRVLDTAGNRGELVAALRAFSEQGRLATLLDRLDSYKEKVDIKYAETFVAALFDIGDELPERPVDFFTVAPDTYAFRIIYWYLRQESDIDRRGQILRSAVESTTGLYLPTYVVSLEGGEKVSDKRLTTDADLAVLKDLSLGKIRKAAETGPLTRNSRMLSILYDWKRWAGEEEPKSWVEGLVNSGGVLHFLKATLQKTASRGVADYSSEITEGISAKYVEDFIPLEKVNEAIRKIRGTPEDDRERLALKAWDETWERKKGGKGDKCPFDLEDSDD